MGLVYLVDFYGSNVGKDTSSINAMVSNLFQTVSFVSVFSKLKLLLDPSI